MCTNFSTSGEKVVLQTNLESLASTFKTDENGEYINSYLKENTKLFGNYDFKTKTFNFNNELYTFTSTYNHTYIDTYNEAKKGTSGYKEFEPLVKAGIHLTKDLYGNGYTINMSNLCYPNNGKISSETQKLTPDKEKDYFFGPLPLVTIGSLSEMSVVKAFGQDNIGLYLDGDNLVINDVKLRNTNNIDNMYNLYYTGTVIEVNGNNNTIKNSVMSHGKNVLRAFSTNNLLVENSILHTGEEFLAKLGSNKINKVDTSKNISINYNDSIINDSFNHFYDTTSEDALMSSYVYYHSKAISKLGNRVILFAINNYFPFFKRKIKKQIKKIDGIEIHFLNRISFSNFLENSKINLNGLSYYNVSKKEIKKILKNEKIDFVDAH